MDPHRINQTSLVTTVQRQTPKDDFGNVLAQTASSAARLGAGILGGAMGNPVVSAAVTAVSGVVNIGSGSGGGKPQSIAGGSVGSLATGSGAVGAAAAGTGTSWDLLAAQQALQSDSQSFNMQYLQLQDQMQKESREFTTVSNIMKVRNDTAKNAINNIH